VSEELKAGSARILRCGIGLALGVLALIHSAAAVQPEDAAALLKRADSIKTANPLEFTSILETLDAQSGHLTAAERDLLHYLHGWKGAYDGNYSASTALLEATLRETGDVTLKFRCRVTLVNVLTVAARYEDAFTQLSQLLTLLPSVTDKVAREQGLMVAAQLYNEVGQYDLGIHYAQIVIDENWQGRGICRGEDQKMRALIQSGKLQTVSPELTGAIDACTRRGENGFANSMRTYLAKVYLAENRPDEAIGLLTGRYEDVRQTQFKRLISSYEALLAQAYSQKGDATQGRQFALRAVDDAASSNYAEPQVSAYRVLYELAKRQGDFKSALDYHERYAVANKGYLDVVTARQLAYQRVTHESVASRLQIEALNKENHVLQLQRALSAKAVENSRLYIALLLMMIGFVAFWAYRTKRSQLHFMSLSQLDGLTGIANRPHFMKQAKRSLESARKSGQPACIILCDLDHFKSINDKYGHAAGDVVLKKTVEACQKHLRRSDVFGRFGGEEFGILLAGCGLEDARFRAEQLRMTIAEIPANAGAGSRVSASFGIASTSSIGYDLGQLLAHADSALYAAKRGGRNCVVAYDKSVTVLGPAVPRGETQLPGSAAA